MSYNLRQRQEVQLADLRARLQDSLDHMNDSRDMDAQQALDEQMRVLELIFKRSIAEADGIYKETATHLNLALRAQDQFRKTLQTHEVLSERDRNRNVQK